MEVTVGIQVEVEVEEEEMVVEVEVEETVSNVGSRVTGPENALVVVVVVAAVAVAVGILLGMVILEGVEAAMVTREAVIGMVIGQVAVTAAEAQVGMGKKDVQKIVTGTVAATVLVVTGMAVAVVEAPHAMKGGPKIALVLMIVQVVAAGHPMIEGGDDNAPGECLLVIVLVFVMVTQLCAVHVVIEIGHILTGKTI